MRFTLLIVGIFNIIISTQAQNHATIPILNKQQRSTIQNQTNGFLCYDTISSSYWLFNNNKWTELENKDEKSKSQKNSTLTFYDDLTIPVTSSKAYGSKEPAFDKLTDDGAKSHGVFIYWFDSEGMEELFFTVQLPHKWKVGSTIFPHVHWTIPEDMNKTHVQWGLEYSWASIGETFQKTTILTNHLPIQGDNCKANEHLLTNLGSIDGTGKTISSMLICRVFRDAENIKDSYTEEAGLLQIDFHYEIDSDGSKEILKK